MRALKAMTEDLAHGAIVEEALAASAAWASYRDQRHDLFLTSKPVVTGLLTGRLS